jgi:predicted acyltransferase
VTSAAEELPLAKERLVSLDAYRGFVMIMMVSNGFGLEQLAHAFPDNGLLRFLGYQFSHVEWTGCAAWDLIQPSFTFIVGVAMPYSYAARAGKGDSELKMFMHVLLRSLALVLLGIFLRSGWTFEDTLSQIGLGYAFAYLLLNRSMKTIGIATLLILLWYWLLWIFGPVPAMDKIPADWEQFKGFAGHWNKHINTGNYFDQWFLNLFPRQNEFVANGGGYLTLSFVPTLGTMLLGVMAGKLLRVHGPLLEKIRILFIAGLVCLAAGMAVDGHIWPFVNWDWSVAPIVKRIWTPSWTVFSGGWCFISLAVFLYIIDYVKLRKWTFPLVVVGMNSIVIYCLDHTIVGWILSTWKSHIAQQTFEGPWGRFNEALVITSSLWLICYWLYRQKVFVRI